ncbi:MAG TPA: YceH family protein [Tepidisphaeraceae bacterium]|nr:YceH family protein [Tepidisphaeraceae bacterium]
MIELTADEARVLGVLIEKGFTTPEQYPLTLNAVVNGANQKNNRDPVLTMDEGRAFDALEGLREKKLIIRADMAGSRVNKFRHQAGEALHARPAEVAILAELLLRGPQTLGELRGRASRMQPFESIEAVKNMLAALMSREESLVRELPPAPGSRAERYVQLLSPELHPLDVAGPAAAPSTQPSSGLEARVETLERELADLREALRKLALSIGEPDPFAPSTLPSRHETEVV